MDFERSDPNQRKSSLIFIRIFSKDFQKDFEKISIKILTENLSENVSMILSLWVGQSPQNPNWKSPWKSQLKIDEWTMVFFFQPRISRILTNMESASHIPWLRRGSTRLTVSVRQAGTCVSKAHSHDSPDSRSITNTGFDFQLSIIYHKIYPLFGPKSILMSKWLKLWWLDVECRGR